MAVRRNKNERPTLCHVAKLFLSLQILCPWGGNQFIFTK